MATKSIHKNVNIDDEKVVETFINAIEESMKRKINNSRKTIESKEIKDLKGFFRC